MSTRKERGLSERIYLLDAKYDRSQWNLSVKGSSKSIYKIILSSTVIKCKCMDFAIRKKVCKHLYFILGRILKNSQITNSINSVTDIIENYSNISDMLKEVLHNHVHATGSKDLEKIEYDTNDMCCICFEPFGNETVDQCTMTCKNTFHSECINLWLSKSDNCPLCRSSWTDPQTDNPLEEFNRLILS